MTKTTLGAFCTSEGGVIQIGPFGAQLKEQEYADEGIPVIMPKDIRHGRVDDGTVARVPATKAHALRRHKVRTGAIVLPRRGDLGKRAYIGPEQDGYLCGTGCIQIDLNGTSVDPRFLYLFMEQEWVTAWLENNAVGSTMLNLSTTILERMPLFVPSQDVQEWIVDRISAYDDLIENNRRRIALLENAARTLYREWFVRLRFPGHEHTPVVDGLPEGWKRGSVSDLIDLNPREVRPQGHVRFVPMAALSEHSMQIDVGATEERDTASGPRFRQSDTLLARITPCLENGKTGYVNILEDGEVACGSTEFIVMRGRQVGPCYTYCLARDSGFRSHAIVSMTGSSGRQRVQETAVGTYVLLLPPANISATFEATCEPVFEQIRLLAKQNTRLREARALLLPRLMSGAIAV